MIVFGGGPVINAEEVYRLHSANKTEGWENHITFFHPFNEYTIIYRRNDSPHLKDGTPITTNVSVSEQDGVDGRVVYMKTYAYGLLLGDGYALKTNMNPNGPYEGGCKISDEAGESFLSCGYSKEFIDEALTKTLSQAAAVVMFSAELMACRNITYEDYDPMKHISRQQRRQRERKGAGLIKYKILHINPMSPKTIERRPPKPTEDSVSAHAVRGHFKTFAVEHPAFGKPWGVGTFWCGPFVCGNPEFGLTWNDYHIEIEEGTPSC